MTAKEILNFPALAAVAKVNPGSKKQNVYGQTINQIAGGTSVFLSGRACCLCADTGGSVGRRGPHRQAGSGGGRRERVRGQFLDAHQLRAGVADDRAGARALLPRGGVAGETSCAPAAQHVPSVPCL